jgi:hypothetical protein
MTHNILPTARTAQPTRTAVQLALKDELRTFGFNLQRGAHWLLQDVGSSLVKKVEPRNEAGRLHKLHHLIDSTAQATFSTLQVAQQAAAVAVLPDAAFRTMHFELQPLADYFTQGEPKNPSQLFTNTFYWLLRHALAGKAGTALIARQQAIDEAFWQVQDQHAGLIALAQEPRAPRSAPPYCAPWPPRSRCATPACRLGPVKPFKSPTRQRHCRNSWPWSLPSAWSKGATIPPPTSASACAWPGNS